MSLLGVLTLPALSQNIAAASTQTTTPPDATDAVDAGVKVATPVEQRILYLRRLLKSKTGERMKASEDGNVHAILAAVHEDLARASAAVKAGNRADAERLAKNALLNIMNASRMIPDKDDNDQSALEARYNELRQGLNVFQQAHNRNFQRITHEDGTEAGATYDSLAVQTLIGKADLMAAEGDFAAANTLLKEAQAAITGALREMLHTRTLVHELKLDTPKAEYDYELQRYRGYAELIPVAIEVKIPSPEIQALMKELAEKAQAIADQAQRKANNGEYPTAIGMLLEATDEVREALWKAGVTM